MDQHSLLLVSVVLVTGFAVGWQSRGEVRVEAPPCSCACHCGCHCTASLGASIWLVIALFALSGVFGGLCSIGGLQKNLKCFLPHPKVQKVFLARLEKFSQSPAK